MSNHSNAPNAKKTFDTMHIMKDHEEEHAGANLYKRTICGRL